LVGVWFAMGAIGVGCSGDTDDDDGDTDVADTDDTDTTTDCTGPESGFSAERVTKVLCLEGDVEEGETFYVMNCALCHLLDGTGIDGGGTGANLTLSFLTEEQVVATVLQGIPYSNMDAYHVYPSQDLANVVAYVMETFIND
jgi:mono/diheme cytochrome c family protein